MEHFAFIWDMDGTLVDSYPAIVPAVQEACGEFGMLFEPEEIHEKIIHTSVGSFIAKVSAERGIDHAPVLARFNRLNDERTDRILAMPGAEETLSSLTRAGHSCFVYTHRGASCRAILEHTGLLPYFTEIVTALDGFPRKPSPEAILYLMQKYRLKPDHCFYVGDSSLDIDAAVTAGTASILYLDPASPGSSTGRESMVVQHLTEIRDRFCGMASDP